MYNVYKFIKSKGKDVSERKLEAPVGSVVARTFPSSCFTMCTVFHISRKKRAREKTITDLDKCIIHDELLMHVTE